jgi:hypothetical protein
MLKMCFLDVSEPSEAKKKQKLENTISKYIYIINCREVGRGTLWLLYELVDGGNEFIFMVNDSKILAKFIYTYVRTGLF